MNLPILSFVQLTLLALLPSISSGLGLYDENTCGAHPGELLLSFPIVMTDKKLLMFIFVGGLLFALPHCLPTDHYVC